MKTVARSNEELAHWWASQNKEEGRANNYYFEGAYLYSYGRHFCVGRILPSGAAIITSQSYGMATSKHINYAHRAVAHKTVLTCYDPSESAPVNKFQANQDIASALAEAITERRVKPETRVKSRARALAIAETFNAYLLALPVAEREGIALIDVSNLEGVREELIRVKKEEAEKREQHHKKQAELQKVRAKAREKGLKERLQLWRGFAVGISGGLHDLPVALRRNPGPIDRIETSHGAEIPTEEAIALWKIIQQVREGDATLGRQQRRLGMYMLNQINEDGSIKVGCHNIPYSELELMAKELGLK